MVFCLTACNQQKSSHANDNKMAHANKNEMPQAAHKHIIRKFLPLISDFSSITNMGSIDIEFTPGPCQLVAEGDSDLINLIQYDIDGGILTVNMPTERYNNVSQFAGKTDVTLHISCPELYMVTTVSSGSFRSSCPIRTINLHMGTLGSGTIIADSIICQTFKFENRGNQSSRFKYIDCDEATLFHYGSNKVEANIQARTHVSIDQSNNGELIANVTAPEIETIITDAASTTYNLHTEHLRLSAFTNGTITLTGHAKMQEIKRGNNVQLTNQLTKD